MGWMACHSLKFQIYWEEYENQICVIHLGQYKQADRGKHSAVWSLPGLWAVATPSFGSEDPESLGQCSITVYEYTTSLLKSKRSIH
jgi:hypothetical protein